MIEHLAGTILHKEEDRVVLDVGGVGYGVSVPARTSQALGSVGADARLWIKTHVTETDFSLFGFEHRGEREAFEVFLGISGVGPRLALAVLSTFDIEQIIQIAMTGDAATLKKVPGIGLKKAEKLILELKGRVDRLSAGVRPQRLAELGTSARIEAFDAQLPNDAARDAARALEALGVQTANARRAILRAIEAVGEGAAVEDLVREGLRHRHAV